MHGYTMQVSPLICISCTLVNRIVNDISGRVNENNIITTWSAPTDAGVCCERYHVVTSEGDNVTINTMSYTVHNITTQEQRENAFISVSCLDQLETEGPENVFRPNIGMFVMYT